MTENQKTHQRLRTRNAEHPFSLGFSCQTVIRKREKEENPDEEYPQENRKTSRRIKEQKICAEKVLSFFLLHERQWGFVSMWVVYIGQEMKNQKVTVEFVLILLLR